MTVDLLNHILPLIDDGPADLDQSVEMVKQAASQGVTALLATPHAGDNRFSFSNQGIKMVSDGLKKVLAQQNIDMKLWPASVNRLNETLSTKLRDQALLYADDGKHYLLVEMSDKAVAVDADQVMGELFNTGITPVLCHPERNPHLMEKRELLTKWANYGCKIMLSASAYTGYYGDEARAACRQLIDSGMAYFFGSDAHDASDGPRGNHLGEAYQQLLREYGKEKAAEFDQNARDLVNGDRIREYKVKSRKKPKTFGMALRNMLKL